MPDHFESRTHITGRHTPDAGDDATISLKPLVEALSIYRRVIGLSVVTAIAATTVVLLAIAL